MATIEIKQNEWQTYFDRFSKQNQGRTVVLREEGMEIGSQEEVTARAFVGISSDTKGSGAGSVVVMLGTEPNDNMERVIASPKTVFVREADGEMGAPAIEINEDGGTKVILDFQTVPTQVGA